MKKTWQKFITLALAGAMSLSMISCGVTNNGGDVDTGIRLPNVTQAKNVILLIGDGMGPAQIRAGELYKGEKLTMQKFPHKTMVQTRSASGLTDSAAAATALATGTRTSNGYVGRYVVPATGETTDLETIVDIAHGLGKRTGVIATEELHGATPMGFSAHSNSRGNTDELLSSAATSSNVNLFASYTIHEKYIPVFTDAGYTRITDADLISESTEEKIIGSYSILAEYEPMMVDGSFVSFDRLVTEALEYLSKDEDGFFLMAEGSHIDHGGHNNDIRYMLDELLAFDNMIAAVLEWAKDRDDTVVIVTADHETGGLILDRDATHVDMLEAHKKGYHDCFEWTSTGHTNDDVNLYINGADINFAEFSFKDENRIKNIEVFEMMKTLMIGKETE